MAKQKKSVGQSKRVGGLVIGSEGFAKISAVEGIRLTGEMKKRAGDKHAQGLTAEEHRRRIIRSYRKG